MGWARPRGASDCHGFLRAPDADVFTPMLNATGQPRPQLFLDDSLHMTRAGYLLWRSRLTPIVR